MAIQLDYSKGLIISSGGYTGSGLGFTLGYSPPVSTAPASDPATAGIIAGINPLDVAAATYGKVIPIVVGGAPRIGGYIIYGPKFVTTSGLSYVSFGVSFGLQADPEGERELWEIRMDGVKVWTVEDGALIDGLTFRFTEGTEVQEPDAMLVADYGAAAPAFRSQCCIFFESLPIARFDNHIPFVSAVIADVTDGAEPTEGILLGDALERLARSAFVGLSSDQFETTGVTPIILALIEAERGSFMDLLQRLARLFPLDVVQTDKLRVIERSSIVPDIVLNTNRIVGGPNAVSIQRQPETDVAQELEFTYIDIDRDYEYTPQKDRRASDPVALTSSRGKETINLPVVTTASNAISWVTLRKYYDEVARKSVSFTAMPYGMEIDPGTMVAVKLDLATYVVRVAETLHEARGTVKCVGAPVLRCSVSVIDDGPEIGDEDDVSALFVAGGTTGSIVDGDPLVQSSPDGVTWTARTSVPAADSYWIDSADFNGLFIMVGADEGRITPRLMTSLDGIVWAAATLPTSDGELRGCNADGLLAVSVGTINTSGDPLIITSPDGSSWTQRTSPFSASDLYGVAYGSSAYAAVGGNALSNPIVATSPDGITWTSRTPVPATNAAYFYVASNGSLFVAVGVEYSGGTTLIATSPDGVTWTQRSNPGGVGELYAVRYADGYFVAVGDGADYILMSSPDGITWTSRTLPDSGVVLNDVSISGGTWIVTGGQIFTSEDLATWTEQTSAFPGQSLYTICGRG